MIKKFFRVNDSLFRGSKPDAKDLFSLKNKLGVNKIVSLDTPSSNEIDHACKLLGLEHVTIGIDADSKASILKLLNHDIVKLFTENPNIFVHCFHGKDRTGLAIAIFRCKHDGWPCDKALKEAEAFGFGTGLDNKVLNLYKKLIAQSCKLNHNHIDLIEDKETLDNNDTPQVGITNNPTGLKGNLGIVDNDGGFLFEGFLNG